MTDFQGRGESLTDRHGIDKFHNSELWSAESPRLGSPGGRRSLQNSQLMGHWWTLMGKLGDKKVTQIACRWSISRYRAPRSLAELRHRSPTASWALSALCWLFGVDVGGRATVHHLVFVTVLCNSFEIIFQWSYRMTWSCPWLCGHVTSASLGCIIN